jgi:outer membrane lipoprotein SlyB
MRALSGGLLIVSLLIAGCESSTGTGALVGAGIGVGAGALIGGGGGALIGGAAGAVGGALIGYLLSQEDQERLERSSPQTVRRINKGEQLSITDIEKMSNAGISDSKIIEVIDATGSVYHLSSREVTELQDAGVSQRVIDHMLRTGY